MHTVHHAMRHVVRQKRTPAPCGTLTAIDRTDLPCRNAYIKCIAQDIAAMDYNAPIGDCAIRHLNHYVSKPLRTLMVSNIARLHKGTRCNLVLKGQLRARKQDP